VIDANHLLVPRDNPRFHGGDSFESPMMPLSAMLAARKHFCKARPGSSLPITPNASRARQRGDICGYVPRPAQALALLGEIHDGNGRFRREPRGRAPKVAVQHEIAEHADALAAQARDPSFNRGTASAMLVDMRSL